MRERQGKQEVGERTKGNMCMKEREQQYSIQTEEGKGQRVGKDLVARLLLTYKDKSIVMR